MKKKLKPVLAAVLIAVIIAATYFSAKQVKVDSEGSMYDERLILYEGWKSVTGKGEKPLRLPWFVQPAKDGTAVLKNTLPSIINPGTYLAVFSNNAYVVVEADGEEVYATHEEPPSETLPEWHYLRIDPKYAGKEIVLTFSGPEPFYAGMITEVLMGSYGELMMYTTVRASYDRWINVSILFVGILVLLFALVTFTNKRESVNYLFLGMLILLLGICGMGRNVTADSAQEYRMLPAACRALYGLLPAVYCLYYGRALEGRRKKKYKLLASVTLLYTAVSAALRLVVPPTFRPVLHYAAGAVFCAIILICLHDLMQNNERERLLNRILRITALSVLLLGHVIGSFTHLGETYIRTVRPETIGGLIFAILQTAAGLLSAYAHLERQLDLERELNDGRIKLMINQIKPHFINNVMTTIRSMIQYDPDEADEMVYKFNKYLVYNIDALSSTELCPFSMELKHIETYLTIELTHLRPRLHVKYDIKLDDFEIPPLSVQPFVENAVKHGIAPKMEAGTLKISTDETEHCYRVTIEDDGVGFDTSKPYDRRGGHGLGMNNAIQRLKLLVNGSVQIESAPGSGTRVTVSVPKLKEEDFDEDDIG